MVSYLPEKIYASLAEEKRHVDHPGSAPARRRAPRPAIERVIRAAELRGQSGTLFTSYSVRHTLINYENERVAVFMTRPIWGPSSTPESSNTGSRNWDLTQRTTARTR